jgi:DNA-binding FrmR family transcriptional regulator
MYTLAGYPMPHHNPKLIARLSRIQGQVGGIARMIEDDRYCIDILVQIRAIKSGLRKVEDELLASHSDHCVADAIKSGNVKDARAKLNELIELFSRTAR